MIVIRLIRARKGVVVATGGSSSNVAFRTMFDVRLTPEYQAGNGDWWPRHAGRVHRVRAVLGDATRRPAPETAARSRV